MAQSNQITNNKLLDVRTVKKIARDELQRLDVRTVIIGIYWQGGYRYLHLSPQTARELFRGAHVLEAAA